METKGVTSKFCKFRVQKNNIWTASWITFRDILEIRRCVQSYYAWPPPFEWEAAHRVSGHWKCQKRSFQTILKHFKKKRIPKSIKNFLSKSISKLDTRGRSKSQESRLQNRWNLVPHNRDLLSNFSSTSKYHVENIENRFRQEIFDGFWISKKQSDSKLSGKNVFGVYNGNVQVKGIFPHIHEFAK